MRRVVCIGLVFLFLAAPVRAQPGASLFFYSPDFSPGNLSVLKQAAEAYLAESGMPVRFQAFVRFEDFRRELATQQPEFVVVPHWAGGAECIGPGTRAIAAPVRSGETFGRKALVTSRTVKRVSELASGSIATTVPPGGVAVGSELDRLRREHPTLHVIAVPKDIDALLAVAFGQVSAAYVSIRQLGIFAAANPKLGGELKEIGYAESMPFPMVYATASAKAEQIEKLRSAAMNVAASGTGKRLVGLLGYDGWVAVDSQAQDGLATRSRAESCGAEGKARP
jgi:ABC-type amino acid transport substrate-binding protein